MDKSQQDKVPQPTNLCKTSPFLNIFLDENRAENVCKIYKVPALLQNSYMENFMYTFFKSFISCNSCRILRYELPPCTCIHGVYHLCNLKVWFKSMAFVATVYKE